MRTIQGREIPDKTALRRARIGHYLPDLVYGANDGIITTFAVVSGVVGADLSRTIILILGFANLFADGISMGASNYLARRSSVEARSSREDAFRHAAATIAAFVAAGLVPLVAYLLPLPPDSRFVAAAVLTAATLFSVGAARSFVTRLSPLRSGLEMLLIGALAAVAAYLIGAFASLFTETGVGSSRAP
jgi:vacuolar iron transporter family protein